MKVVLALFGTLVAAVMLWGILRDRRRFVRLQGTWASYAAARGLRFEASRGSAIVGLAGTSTPRVHGVRADVPFELACVGGSRTGLRCSRVTVPALGDGTLTPSLLSPRASSAFEALRSRRPHVELQTWQEATHATPQPGRFVSVTWHGLEEDPAVLDLAIDLATQLAVEQRAGTGRARGNPREV